MEPLGVQQEPRPAHQARRRHRHLQRHRPDGQGRGPPLRGTLQRRRHPDQSLGGPKERAAQGRQRRRSSARRLAGRQAQQRHPRIQDRSRIPAVPQEQWRRRGARVSRACTHRQPARPGGERASQPGRWIRRTRRCRADARRDRQPRQAHHRRSRQGLRMGRVRPRRRHLDSKPQQPCGSRDCDRRQRRHPVDRLLRRAQVPRHNRRAALVANRKRHDLRRDDRRQQRRSG